MATNYPGSLDTSTQQPSPSASTEMDDSGFEHDAVHTNHSGAIIALETKVGTGDSNAVANSVLAGTGSGTSGWTTTPTVTGLTVNGDTSSTGHFTAQSGGADGGIVLGQTYATDYVGLRTAGMGEASNDEYVIMSNGTTTFISGGTGGDVYIRAGANSSSCQIILDTSENDINITGSVGIGAAPTYLLDVAGTFRATGIARFENDIRGKYGSASDPSFTFDGDADTGMYRVTTNQVGFATSGTLRGRFWSSGLLMGNASTGNAQIGTGTGSASAPTYHFYGDTDTGIYRSGTNQMSFATGGSEAARFPSAGDLRLQREGVVLDASGKSYWSLSPPTGTGNDAEWTAAFGYYYLRRNSSTAAEKVNIQTDLEGWLTPEMIDSVVPKMWARTETPDYPEIGPIAEDMDAISPFLGTKGTDDEGEVFLNGIDRNAYLSLLVLAVKDLRTRVADLEAA